MLNSEKNTSAMRQRVSVAAHRALEVGQFHKHLHGVFEHGQWWVECRDCGRQWSVVDAEGPGTCDGFDFEVVAEGNESCYDRQVDESEDP